MTSNIASTKGISWISIAAAVLVGSIAALVVNTLPVFLAVFARAYEFDEAQVGLIALAELGGIAVGTIGVAMTPGQVERLGWRKVAMMGLGVMIAANLLTMAVTSYGGLLAIRAITGVGCGLTLAITYAVLAQGDGARDLAVFNVVQLSAGAFGMTILGSIVDGYGQAALFGLIATIAVAGSLLCTFLPNYSHSESVQAVDALVRKERVSLTGWIAVGSALLYFVGAGAVFAYLAFMGVAWGGEAAAIETGLSTVMISAVMGGVVVAIVGSRFGFRIPLYVGYVGLLSSILLLALIQPVANFILIACVFGFFWNILTPYQFEAITHTDRSDSAAMLVNASTLGGIAIGPAIAGYLVTPDYLQVNVMALSACFISLILILLALNLHKRNNNRQIIRSVAEQVL